MVLKSALIVSASERSGAYLKDMLMGELCESTVTLPTCGEARRLLLEQDFELIIIDSPLRDETGESFSRHIAAKGLGQVILLVKAEFFDAVSKLTEDYGVLTVSKPFSPAMLRSALKLAQAAQNRLVRQRTENSRLTQKIDDIRIVDRAKRILISFLNISEQEAHRYIEKQAMDLRTSKRSVAEGILKRYEE